MNKKSLFYYTSRVIQRFLLCMVVGATVIHWIILIFVTGSLSFTSKLENSKFRNPELLNNDINRILNIQTFTVLRWAIICALATSLLLFIKRYRKYEKPMIVDSLCITVFCLASVVLSQVIVRAFISHLSM